MRSDKKKKKMEIAICGTEDRYLLMIFFFFRNPKIFKNIKDKIHFMMNLVCHMYTTKGYSGFGI